MVLQAGFEPASLIGFDPARDNLLAFSLWSGLEKPISITVITSDLCYWSSVLFNMETIIHRSIGIVHTFFRLFWNINITNISL